MSCRVRHVAGIIPLWGQDPIFKMPWHDSMMPVGDNYVALERAIHECACAGCSSIWVVCPPEMQKLIRNRVGEWITDPVSVYVHPRRTDSRTVIPIYYITPYPVDIGRKDSLPWSILYAAQVAGKTIGSLSRCLPPDKFYVAFPYGVYNPEFLIPERKLLLRKGMRFYVSYNKKTVRDGEYLGFAISVEDIKELRKTFRQKASGGYDSEGVMLRPEEKYSGRWFTLDTIFQYAIMSKTDMVAEAPWYYKITSWKEYWTYAARNPTLALERPHEAVLKYHEWNRLGVKDDGQPTET